MSARKYLVAAPIKVHAKSKDNQLNSPKIEPMLRGIFPNAKRFLNKCFEFFEKHGAQKSTPGNIFFRKIAEKTQKTPESLKILPELQQSPKYWYIIAT